MLEVLITRMQLLEETVWIFDKNNIHWLPQHIILEGRVFLLHWTGIGMDKSFHHTFYWVCDYVSMPGLKLIHIRKRAQLFIEWLVLCLQSLYVSNFRITVVQISDLWLKLIPMWEHKAHFLSMASKVVTNERRCYTYLLSYVETLLSPIYDTDPDFISISHIT